MNKLITTLALTTAVASTAWAESGYIGADIGRVDAEITADYFSGGFDTQPIALRLKGGGELNKNLAIEGYIGMGVSKDTVKDTDIDAEVDTMIGLDIKGLLPIGDAAALYAKAGLARISFKDSENDTYTKNGLTYGVGANVSVGKNMALTLDYTVFPDAENKEYELDVESSMISIGFQYYP